MTKIQKIKRIGVVLLSLILVCTQAYAEGENWTKMSAGISANLNGLWFNSAKDIFAVGDEGKLFHSDGNTWSEMLNPASGTLMAVHGTSGKNVFAVGKGGLILRYDGKIWQKTKIDTTDNLRDINFTAVWVMSESDAFAVTLIGRIFRYNGTAWTEITSPVKKSLFNISGMSANSLFAVGNTIVKYDGTAWEEMTSPTSRTLMGISAISDTDVYAVGDSGTVLHYDGTDWSKITFPSSDNLRGVWANSEMDVFAVGEKGAIYHYDGTAWQNISGNTADTFTGLWKGQSCDIFAVGLAGAVFYLEKSSLCPCSTCYVTPSGSDTGNGSETRPFKTVQKAIASAQENDTVRIQAGTYNENILIGKNIFLQSDADKGELYPVIDGKGTGPVITFQNSEAILKNITLKNGTVGILCNNSNPTLIHVAVTGNSGEGISCSNSDPELVGVTVSGNAGGGISCADGSDPVISNSVLWNDLPQEIAFKTGGNPNSVTVSYSNVQGGQSAVVTNSNGTVTWSAGNVSLDPVFADADNADFRLCDDSPLIGAGTVITGKTDSEPSGSNPDMGAYENPLAAPIKILYVDSSFTGLDEKGTRYKPYKTVTDAISNVVADTDSIRIAKGNYSEAVEIDALNTITLEGGWNNAAGVWTRDESIDPNLTAIMPDDDIEGMTITNASGVKINGLAIGNGVIARGCDNLLFTENVTIGTTAMLIDGCNNAEIVNNDIAGVSENSDSGKGLVVLNSANINVEANFIQADTLGTHFNASSGTITGNSYYIRNITQSETSVASAIKLEALSGDVEISNNVLYLQGRGFGPDGEGVYTFNTLTGIEESGTVATPKSLLKNQYYGYKDNLIFYHDGNGEGDITDVGKLNDDTLDDISERSGNYFCMSDNPYVPCAETEGSPCTEIVEIAIPTGGDADGDGLPDDWERYYFGNLAHGPDEDFDAIPVPSSKRDKRDDNNTASGGDGLTIKEEYLNNTNPLTWDTDGDGMPDGWEVKYRLNPREKEDGIQDKDGDGYTNLAEYRSGNSPADIGSYPKFDPKEGIFNVGTGGKVLFNPLFDGGLFEGEAVIFLTEGMKEFESNLIKFIQEIQRQVTAGDAHIVFSDKKQGAQFGGLLGEEKDYNHGPYTGIKTVEMEPGAKFALMFVPNASLEEICDDPSMMYQKGSNGTRPFFSFSSPNSDFGVHLSLLSDINGLGTAFVFEDVELTSKDLVDYNDLIFQLGGLTGESPAIQSLADKDLGNIPLLDTRIPVEKDWRRIQDPNNPNDPGYLGEKIIEHSRLTSEKPADWIKIILEPAGDLLLYDPQGREFGKEGGYIPGAVFDTAADGKQMIFLLAPDEGDYRIVLRRVPESGLCRVTVKAYQEDTEISSQEKQGDFSSSCDGKPALILKADLKIPELTLGDIGSPVASDGTPLCYDINGDGRTDRCDIKKIASKWDSECLSEWNCNSDYDEFYDFDKDGYIGVFDIMQVTGNVYPPEDSSGDCFQP